MRRFLAHSISVARSAAGRKRYGLGSGCASWRSGSALEGERSCRAAPGRSGAAAPARRRGRCAPATPGAPSRSSRARISPAALSVKVTARISSGRNVSVPTWWAIRRVIVVVLPEPAPARMHTGPRTASTARRCSGLRPASASTAPAYAARSDGFATGLRQLRFAECCRCGNCSSFALRFPPASQTTASRCCSSRTARARCSCTACHARAASSSS